MSDDMILLDEMTVPLTWNQLGILVLDGSGSMTGIVEGNIKKAEAVDDAVRGLLTRLKASREKANFSIGVVTFDSQPKRRLQPTRVFVDKNNTIDDYGDYNPLNGHGGGTDLSRALEEAESMAAEFLGQRMEGIPTSVVIVVMSDGLSGTDPESVANRIKQNESVKIAATIFASTKDNSSEVSQGEKILKSIVSETRLYKRTYDPITLREFFIASVSSGTGANIV